MEPVPSSKSSSSNESELREQLATEATTVVQGEIDELRKRSEEAEEKQARTQKEMEEYKKLTDINNKAMEDNNAPLKRILAINNASST
jgi:molecular chaperone GrpE (heat shock protein)